MKKTIKSGLTLIMAAVMCLAMLPMTASAEVDWYAEFVIDKGVLRAYNGPGGHVVIPDGVVILGNGVFGPTGGTDRPMLTSVTIPDSVKVIGAHAFEYCTELTSVTIPDSVIIIDTYAFRGCTSLTKVTLGSVEGIGSSAFEGCTALKSVTLPGSLSGQIYSLEQYTLNNQAWSYGISYDVFRDCTALESVTFKHGVTRISDSLFRGCMNLKTVEIPESVIDIDRTSFRYTPDNRVLLTLPNLTIYGKSGSYAETYAKENDIPFVSTGATATPPDPNPKDPPKTTEKSSTWAEANVNTAIAANLVPQGLQEKYTQATTRAEFCALAVALYETVTGTTITDRKTFDDTSDINIEKMAAIGVVSGVGDNKFSPNTGLTREQAATMLSRLANAIGKPLTQQAATFADKDSISLWAIEAVGQIQAAGIMGGVGNNTFAPKSDYTREQSIVTILRLYVIVK